MRRRVANVLKALQTVLLDMWSYFWCPCVLRYYRIDRNKMARMNTLIHQYHRIALCLLICTWNINMFCGLSTFSFFFSFLHMCRFFTSFICLIWWSIFFGLSYAFISCSVQLDVNRFRYVSNSHLYLTGAETFILLCLALLMYSARFWLKFVNQTTHCVSQ